MQEGLGLGAFYFLSVFLWFAVSLLLVRLSKVSFKEVLRLLTTVDIWFEDGWIVKEGATVDRKKFSEFLSAIPDEVRQKKRELSWREFLLLLPSEIRQKTKIRTRVKWRVLGILLATMFLTVSILLIFPYILGLLLSPLGRQVVFPLEVVGAIYLVNCFIYNGRIRYRILIERGKGIVKEEGVKKLSRMQREKLLELAERFFQENPNVEGLEIRQECSCLLPFCLKGKYFEFLKKENGKVVRLLSKESKKAERILETPFPWR
jgi:hypothetical protein